MADRDASPVDVGDVAGDVSLGPNNGTAASQPEPEPECYYQSLGEFAGWLLDVYRRSTRGQARVFCPQWWKHPEVIARIDALWRAFEQLRRDPRELPAYERLAVALPGRRTVGAREDARRLSAQRPRRRLATGRLSSSASSASSPSVRRALLI